MKSSEASMPKLLFSPSFSDERRAGVCCSDSGVPFGARYDPIGPPGVPGFEPERFMPPRQPRQPGQNWPGNHPDLPPHRNDDMFM